ASAAARVSARPIIILRIMPPSVLRLWLAHRTLLPPSKQRICQPNGSGKKCGVNLRVGDDHPTPIEYLTGYPTGPTRIAGKRRQDVDIHLGARRAEPSGDSRGLGRGVRDADRETTGRLDRRFSGEH